jgi:riboflavin kinase/FMN adenylyltransferase
MSGDRDRNAAIATVVDLDAAPTRRRRLAVGVFDGVHVGHQEVMRGCDTVLTFSPHPREFFLGAAPARLGPVESAQDLVGGLGVREIVVARFDAALASMTPESFATDLLVGRLGAEHVSVGEGFHFGLDAAGTTATLAASGHFTLRVVDLRRLGGQAVSSTGIRRAVRQGDVEAAARMLGRPVVVPCRTLGPTGSREGELMLEPLPGVACPPPGAYVCAVGGREAVGIVDRAAVVGGRAHLRLTLVSELPGDQDRVLVEVRERLGRTSVRRLRGVAGQERA